MKSFNEEKLKKAIENFRAYSKDKRFAVDTKERQGRKKFFSDLFKKNTDEYIFSEMIKKLWASRIWGNKDYLVTKIIKDNGIDKINEEIKAIASKKGTSGQRYDKFLGTIKGMGPSMVTELLCYSDPENCGIWNSVARNSLAWLEAKEIPFNTYRIESNDYDKFNIKLKELAKILKAEGHNDVDLLLVDYFLWETNEKFVTDENIRNRAKDFVKDKKTDNLSRHDELRDKIAQIGSWLGFETETEKPIAIGARVDTVWKAKIANLGTVTYVFEVQDKGSIDGLILNLQKAQNGDRTVQKLIVVSDDQQIKKVEKEIESLGENFRNAVVYWSNKSVDETHNSLEQVTMNIANLKLFEE